MQVLKSTKFWYAVIGLVLNIVAWLVPDIPSEIRVSLSTVLTALVGALIGAHAYTDAKTSSAGIIADGMRDAAALSVPPSAPSSDSRQPTGRS